MIKQAILISLLLFTFTVHAMGGTDTVARAQFTSQISNKEPINNLIELENTFTSVFFFTDIRECVSCNVEHVWYLDGKHMHTQKGIAKYPRYRWWSKKTLDPNVLGTWTVRVKINDTTQTAKNLNYFAPTEIQQMQAPIQTRMLMNEQTECEKRVQHFSDKLNDSPDDLYYKFMFKKWAKRCSD